MKQNRNLGRLAPLALALLILGGCAAPCAGQPLATAYATQAAGTAAPSPSPAPSAPAPVQTPSPVAVPSPVGEDAAARGGFTDFSTLRSPSIRVYKAERTLELWNGKKMVASWPMALGWEPAGHKREEGDGRTPEGEYYVCTRNANSSFYKSLGVSYPNRRDADAAYESGLIGKKQRDAIRKAISGGKRPPWNTPLGGEIMIHGGGSGSDWTAGCIAVGNEVMDSLWTCCRIGTKITIYP